MEFILPTFRLPTVPRKLLVQLDLSACSLRHDRQQHSASASETIVCLDRRHLDLAMSLVRSYITGRMQFVRFGDCCSATTINMFSMLQGSALGLTLLSPHVAPIADVIKVYDVMHTQMTIGSTLGGVEPVQQRRTGASPLFIAGSQATA